MPQVANLAAEDAKGGEQPVSDAANQRLQDAKALIRPWRSNASAWIDAMGGEQAFDGLWAKVRGAELSSRLRCGIDRSPLCFVPVKYTL